MEHIVCSFLVFLCGSMTHLRISLRFFFSHLRGWSLDQLGKNSLRMRSKSHNLKIDSKNKNLLQMSQVSPHISTYHLHSDAWYPSKWQNLQSAPWQFKLHPEVSAESRLSILSPLPIRHPDVLKRWNWHLGCGIHILILFEALLWLAYICISYSILILCLTMLHLWFKIQSSNHPIRINSCPQAKTLCSHSDDLHYPRSASERLSGVLGTAGTASRLPNTAPWALGASWRKASSW